MGAVNGDGDRLPPEQMGLGTASWYSTGFPGSDSGNTAAATAGAEVGRPVVSTPLASSQVPGNTPQVQVLSGDSSSFSDDVAVHPNALIPTHTDTTGIGQIRAPRSV